MARLIRSQANIPARNVIGYPRAGALWDALEHPVAPLIFMESPLTSSWPPVPVRLCH